MKRSAAALLAAGLLALAGCAAPADSPAPAAHTGRDFNDADVMFLQMMVPHHEQGLTIARLARDRSAREDVRVLAAAVETTQTDEVATMSGWLRDWDAPPTAPPNSHHDHGGMPDTTAREIATLRRISGAEFDHRFLNVMISHQDDAIQLARLETAAGTNPQAKALAEQIDRSRTAQITQMLDYLGQG
jgi:uncharacterized protein (DUF305 family)